MQDSRIFHVEFIPFINVIFSESPDPRTKAHVSSTLALPLETTNPQENSNTKNEEKIISAALDIIISCVRKEKVDTIDFIRTPPRAAATFKRFINQQIRNPHTALMDNLQKNRNSLQSLIFSPEIPIIALCEIHLFPFFGKVVIAYMPRKYAISSESWTKFINDVSLGLHNQERITQDIAALVMSALRPHGVGVALQVMFSCKLNSSGMWDNKQTISSCTLGAMQDDFDARNQFLTLINSWT